MFIIFSLHVNQHILYTNILALVLHGNLFSSPPQRPMTSDFEGFSIPDFIHYIYFPILILELAMISICLIIQLTRIL